MRKDGDLTEVGGVMERELVRRYGHEVNDLGHERCRMGDIRTDI